MKTITIIGIAVACLTALLLLALYMRKENYETTASAQAPPIPVATTDPADLAALRTEIQNCNQDRACMNALIKRSLKFQTNKNLNI